MSESTDCSTDVSSRTQIITRGHFPSSVAFVHFHGAMAVGVHMLLSVHRYNE